MNIPPPLATILLLMAFTVGMLVGYATHRWRDRYERTRWLRENGWE
ncbi:MAG: hypothetical protein JWL84_2538 [Rhodospirillales bacterium]|jgi:hypothetical protein|nr:hypothetical protein [Rhodospirillales bacterium]